MAFSIDIKDCPKEVWKHEFIIATLTEEKLTYVTHTTNGFKASQMASEIPNGIVIRNVRLPK